MGVKPGQPRKWATSRTTIEKIDWIEAKTGANDGYGKYLINFKLGTLNLV